MINTYISILAQFDDWLDELIKVQRDLHMSTADLATGIIETDSGSQKDKEYTALLLATAIQRLA